MKLTNEQIAAARELCAKASNGPWEVRPHRHDDWGFVRAAPDEKGDQWLVACARGGHLHFDFDECRRNGTDPYEHNAAFIAASRSLLPLALDAVEELQLERDSWMETAGMHCRNEQYYRGLVEQIGQHFGEEARKADDGTIYEDVLCIKVPELVEEELRELHEAIGLMTTGKGDMVMRPDDPIDMAQEVVKHVDDLQADNARLRGLLERLGDNQMCAYGICRECSRVDGCIFSSARMYRLIHSALAEPAGEGKISE